MCVGGDLIFRVTTLCYLKRLVFHKNLWNTEGDRKVCLIPRKVTIKDNIKHILNQKKNNKTNKKKKLFLIEKKKKKQSIESIALARQIF